MDNLVSMMGRQRRTGIRKDDPSRNMANHTVQGTVVSEPMLDGSFMNMVNNDTHNLSNATGITPEEAVKMASDFYQKYPMLVEFVRSQEYMLRGR